MTWKTRYAPSALLTLGVAASFTVACTHVSSTPLSEPQSSSYPASPAAPNGEPADGVQASETSRAADAPLTASTPSGASATASSPSAASGTKPIVSEPNDDTRVNSGAGSPIPVGAGTGK
ncbi:MAG: hypothetical protein ABI548_27380 [Polyangiaceae bacterium]